MLQPHRRAHLRLWIVLAALLPLMLLAAFVNRPRPGEASAPQRIGANDTPLPALPPRGHA
jgi:hypothetical protein